MTIQAIAFDIGGVLEITPDLGLPAAWEARLGLAPGELNRRMADTWRDGSIGAISEAEVHRGGPCVEGARRAGLHAVLYQDNAQAIRDIAALLAA